MALSKTKKQRIRDRDRNQCVRCGNGGPLLPDIPLAIHHITPKHDGGTDDEDNLISLCSDCHCYAHRLDETGRWGGSYRDLSRFHPKVARERARQYENNY